MTKRKLYLVNLVAENVMDLVAERSRERVLAILRIFLIFSSFQKTGLQTFRFLGSHQKIYVKNAVKRSLNHPFCRMRQ